MILQKLYLFNYRNYGEINIDFDQKINVLVGPNGSGKTNLLDSIYYLAFTKSAFQAADQINVRHGSNHFFIRGSFLTKGRQHEIAAGYQVGMRKSFREDGTEYQKVSEHIGKYPVVLMAPDDVDLIKEGSESRRKFFDSIISQIDHTYLDNLIQYNLTLKNRNGLLRLFFERGEVDELAIESYDEILDRLGQQLYEKRKAFVVDFIPVFNSFFNFLVEGSESASILYSSDLNNGSFIQGSKNNRQKDLALQRTNFGVHRDDYEFRLGDVDIKRYGSQGQQKSFVIGLKLAQWKMLREVKGFKPVLLLDDIFDKLDDLRIDRLLELIKEFGQLFISDARPDRTTKLLQKAIGNVSVYEIQNGEVRKRI